MIPMIPANDLRKGMAIQYNGCSAIILEVRHRTPGNLRAFVQVCVRYVTTRRSTEIRFSSNERVELIEIVRQTFEFSYSDHLGYHFLDPKTYELITLQEDLVLAIRDYLTENLLVTILKIEGNPAQIELPPSVNLKVIESAEGVRGNSANSATKTAILETGKVIQVPLFVREGQIVRIDTRTGTYLSRSP